MPACPGNISSQLCFTLSELVSITGTIDFGRNVSVHFLAGTHTSNTSGWVEFDGERWNVQGNLAIIGHSDNGCNGIPACSVLIDCTKLKVGFAFVSLRSVSITNINMTQCGYLMYNLVRSRELTPTIDCRLAQPEQLRAAMLIVHIPKISVSKVNISYSDGYGLLIIPIVFSSTDNWITIRNSTFTFNNWKNSAGGSVVIIRVKEGDPITIANALFVRISVVNVHISHGQGYRCWMESEGSGHFRPLAGGLTIFSSYEVMGFINISNSTFTDNKGYTGGGMHVTLPPIPSQGTDINKLNLLVSNCQIRYNRASKGGGVSLQLFFEPSGRSFIGRPVRFFHLENTTLDSNQADLGGGAFFEAVLNGLQDRRSYGYGYAIDYSVEGNCTFSNNQATLGAGMYVSVPSRQLLTNVDKAFRVFLTIKESWYTANRGGALYTTSQDSYPQSDTHFHITLQQCVFSKNFGMKGTAVHVASKSFVSLLSRVKLEDTIVTHNLAEKEITEQEAGSAVYVQQYFLILSNSTITGNALRGIYANNSAVGIRYIVHITNNTASGNSAYGGGIYLNDFPRTSVHIWSQIVVAKDSQLYLDANKATGYGGAIAVSYSGNAEKPCFFSYQHSPEASNLRPAVVVKANTAGIVGSGLFGGALESCHIRNSNTKLTKEYFKSFFSIDGNYSIASVPYKVCVCPQNLTHDVNTCETEYTLSIFPGKIFHIPLIGVGQWNYPAPSVVRARIRSDIALIEDELATQDIGLTCRNVPYQFFSPLQDVMLNMSLVVETAYLRDSFLPTLITTQVKVNILKCPFGFILDNVSQSCQCSDYHNRAGLECNIETVTIRKRPQSWIGNYSGELVIHDHCPFAYCNESHLDVDPYNQQEQCNFNRTGVLCGGCRPGHSLALGTSQCKSDCSNTYLLLLILFALAGVVLVVVLLKCNLTVSTGAINGLILYANIVHENRAIFFLAHIQNTAVYIFSVLIAWLNLDFGIEVCFSVSLDGYTRTWLEFVFPVYIWLIVGALILVSRYSINVSRLCGSNTISVLSTLFLLSYTKILRTTFSAFYPALLVTSNGSEHIVWLVNGNLAFLAWPHSLLFTVALLFLVFFILPFTAVLLFSPLIQRYSHKKRVRWVAMKILPLLDSFHGPYKTKYRNWTGYMLLFRLILLVAFSSDVFGDQLVNLVVVAISLTVLLIIWIGVGRVYKKVWMNALELFFLANLLIFTVLTLYFTSSQNNSSANSTLVLIMVGSALLASCCIIAYQFVQELKQQKLVRKLIQRIMARQFADSVDTPETELDVSGQEHKTMHAVTTTVVELSEILLSDNEQTT